MIEKHEYKIQHPNEFYKDWELVDEDMKKGRIKHWQKEINIAKRNQASARRLLEERGE